MWWFCIIQNLTNSQILYSETLKTRVEYLLVKKVWILKELCCFHSNFLSRIRDLDLSLSLFLLPEAIYSDSYKCEGQFIPSVLMWLASLDAWCFRRAQAGRKNVNCLPPPELLVLLLFTLPSVVTAPKLLIWRSHPLCLHRDGRRKRRGWRELSLEFFMWIVFCNTKKPFSFQLTVQLLMEETWTHKFLWWWYFFECKH